MAPVFNLGLMLCAVPYVAVTLYDVWMHKHDREVPVIERWLHFGVIVLVSGFILSAVLSLFYLALLFLVLCVPLMAWDELAYHQALHPKEKQVHYLAGGCFGFIVVMWLWMT